MRPIPVLPASELFQAARPRSAEGHLFSSETGRYLYLANESCVFGLSDATFEMLSAAFDSPIGAEHQSATVALGLMRPPAIDETPLVSPRVHALSLAVA